MSDYYIEINQLQSGFIVGEDVYKNTAKPIVLKNTKLSNEHIKVLQAFSIKKIKILAEGLNKQEPLTKGDNEKLETKISQAGLPSKVIETQSLEEQYLEAVANYKKKFNSWRAGTPLDVASIRRIVIPVLKRFNENQKLLPLLPELSNVQDYLYHHSIAVGILSFAVSDKLEIPEGQGLQLALAGVLADCGMSKIDPSLLEDRSTFTTEKLNEMKKHPLYSYQMVQETMLLLPEMKLAILQHHERLDGSGYPRGEKSSQISMFSQIIAVVDTFHAVSSERPHQKKKTIFEAIEMIRKEELGKFDFEIVQALQELVCKVSIGSRVQLTNGEKGEIIFIPRDMESRPVIKKDDDSIVELSTQSDLFISKVLD